MIEINIPGKGDLVLKNLVLDLNGTISVDGTLIDGVGERLFKLKKILDIYCITADTLGTAASLVKRLDINIQKIESGKEGEQKLEFIRELGAGQTVTVGNGANDVLMLKEAVIGIAVIGTEGTASAAITAADVVVTDIIKGLDLLLKPNRLIATLRS